MTKKPEMIKLVSAILMTSSLLVGCASDGEPEAPADSTTSAPASSSPAPSTSSSSSDSTSSSSTSTSSATPTAMKKGPNAAAKNAIYSAKIKNARASRVGYEWRDTGKMIAAAEKAAENGDNEKAVKLANAARDQATAAIAQSQSEADRFDSNHGAITLGDSSSMADSSSSMPETKSSDSMSDHKTSSSSTMSTSSSSSDSSDTMMAKPSMAKNDYVVESGDNLWNISGKESIYGNPYQWPVIYKANSDKIKDADLIFPGQVFDIPAASSSEVSAAISHAKSRGEWTLGESEATDQEYLAQ